jgi:hypothetical protein
MSKTATQYLVAVNRFISLKRGKKYNRSQWFDHSNNNNKKVWVVVVKFKKMIISRWFSPFYWMLYVVAYYKNLFHDSVKQKKGFLNDLIISIPKGFSCFLTCHCIISITWPFPSTLKTISFRDHFLVRKKTDPELLKLCN